MRIAFLAISLLVLLDQGSKIWVRQHVDSYHMIPILPNFLELTLVQNKGVSFSFMSDWPETVRLPLLPVHFDDRGGGDALLPDLVLEKE